MAETGQENNSGFAGIDLLSEALGESGLNLEEHFDFFENAPATTLSSSFAGLDYLNVLDNLSSSLPSNSATPLETTTVVQNVPFRYNTVGSGNLFSRTQPISTAVQPRTSTVEFSANRFEAPSSATRVLQQLLSQQSPLENSSQITASTTSSPMMIDLASTSNQIIKNPLTWPTKSTTSSFFTQNITITEQQKELSNK